MPDEPSGYELHRSIEALRQDQREGFANLNQRLDKFVSAEVHAADQRRLDQRIDGVEADVAELKAAKKWAIGIAVMVAGVVVAIAAVVGDFL